MLATDYGRRATFQDGTGTWERWEEEAWRTLRSFIQRWECGRARVARRIDCASRDHQALAIDQYDGRVFDDYAEADAFAKQIGLLKLMA